MHAAGRISRRGWIGPIAAVALAVALVTAAVVVGQGAASSASPVTIPMDHRGDPMMHTEKISKVPNAPTLVAEGWTARATSHAAGHPAANVLDQRPATTWVAKGPAGRAQSITIDMNVAQQVSGLAYRPTSTGAVGPFEIRESTNGVDFGAPVATGSWARSKFEVDTIGLPLRSVRYVRLTALADRTSKAPFAAADITLFGAPSKATLAAATGPVVSTDPSVVGQWGASIGFPIIPVGVAVLPGNLMLAWSADGTTSFANDGAANYTQTAIMNLATGQVSARVQVNLGHNMFCPGVAILANGDVMITGGDTDYKTSVYHPSTNTWSEGPNMNIGRGYQSMATLSNGEAFTVGGSWSGGVGGKMGEIWSSTGGWRELTGVSANPTYTADPDGTKVDSHEWLFATSNGRVFQAGPSKKMNWITTTGAGSISSAGARGNSGDAMNGNAVYYDINKIITMGGAPAYSDSNATAASYAIDLTGGNATVTQVGSMNYARSFANSVVLPTGKVVVMGGSTHGIVFNDNASVLNAEMWDPATGQYSLMAAAATPRTYHSVAVLLPDGRVFSGGGGLAPGCSCNHLDGQIYSPPYLFNSDGSLRTRPTITAAPTTATDGQTISVTTGAPVSSFSMVRYGEATHTVDTDQRRIPLQIVSQQGNTYQLAIPSDPGVAVAGPYMLFAMDSAGTPSVSQTISVANAPTPAPANAYQQSVMANTPSLYWPLGETTGSTAGDLTTNANHGLYATGATPGGASPVEGASGAGVTLNGTGGAVVASQPTTNPTTYSEELWFKTTTAQGGKLIGFGNSSTGQSGNYDRQIYMTNNGSLSYGVYNGGTQVITAAGPYNDGVWHHVVATQSSSGMGLYVDGKLTATGIATNGLSYLGYWRVGGDNLSGWPNQPSSNYFAGTISDAAIYPTALTASQIQTHFLASPAHSVAPPAPVPTSAYGKAVVADGPSGYWPLSDTTGPLGTDMSGANNQVRYNNSGVSYGAASTVESTTGKGVSLDGTTGGLVTTKATNNPQTYSEELWFKTTTTKGGYLIGFGDSSSTTSFSNNRDRRIWMTNNGALDYGIVNCCGARTIQTSDSFNDGNWHHVVATQGSSGMKLYVDSKLQASDSSTTPNGYTGYWHIGSDNIGGWGNQPSSNYFAGTISDAAIYPTALTATQIQTHYQASGARYVPPVPTSAYGKAVVADGPSGYWPLSDTTGPLGTDMSGANNQVRYNNSGVSYGAASTVESTTGKGVSLDGTTGGLVTTKATNNPQTYSEELWFKTTTTKGGYLIGFGDSSSTTSFSNNRDRRIWMTNNGALDYGIVNCCGARTIQTSSSFNDGNWHYVVATQGSSGMKLYVDSKLQASDSSTTPNGYTGYWHIGSDNIGGWGNQPSSNYFAGTISDAAIYPTALTATQIQTHYQASGARN